MRKQLELNLNKGRWGGRRKGSGRARIHSKGVAHRTREMVNAKTPMHINFKYRCSIRNKDCLRILKKAIVNARRFGLRINQFSLQHNHIHLIVEADTNEILTRGMRSLTITFAKRLDKGRVQLERYHLHVLRTIRETKNAIYYVLFNKQKHEKGTCSTVDEYGSLYYVNNWKELVKAFAIKEKMLLRIRHLKDHWRQDSPKSWLLSRAFD